MRAEMDYYTIYVYSPAMIALEKLRAICQQMEDYTPTKKTRRPRARDFFDIFTIVNNTDFRFDAVENRELLRLIFGAKQVPLALLRKVGSQRDYHRVDWPSVQSTVSGPIEDFDYYFDFVLQAVDLLHPPGME